jgi:putative transposase
MARQARLKEQGSYYHCITRVVDGKFIFGVENPAAHGAEAAEKFRELLWKLAEFHGITVVTWALLSNHSHLLLKEPDVRRTEIEDTELVAKVRALNGKKAAAELAWQLRHFREEVQHPELAEELKARYLARMGDVSRFMQELNGRFAQWYNRKHKRFGAVWAERFKSILVEGDSEVLLTVAAYIDLNAVRVGLVQDPADYRYCGYGEAVSGNLKQAKKGLVHALGLSDEEIDAGVEGSLWRKLQAEYRRLLYGAGVEVTRDGHPFRLGPSMARAVEVQEIEEGHLSMTELLRKRIRYFSAGLAIGSRTFVNKLCEKHRGQISAAKKCGERAMRANGFEKFCALRSLRRAPTR